MINKVMNQKGCGAIVYEIEFIGTLICGDILERFDRELKKNVFETHLCETCDENERSGP